MMRPTPRMLAPGFVKRSLDEFKRLSGMAFTLEAIKTPTGPYKLLDFGNPSTVQSCKIMSDADLGGFSTVALDHVPPSASEPAHARFHGNISIDLPTNRPEVQRTGYAAWRNHDRPATIFGKSLWNMDPYAFLALRFKSDGRKYFVNVQTESIVYTDIHQHRLYARKPGEWETVLIKWGEFVRTNYGQVVEPQTEMLTQKVRTVGIGLTDRIPGPFDLAISGIWATNGIVEGVDGTKGNIQPDANPVRSESAKREELYPEEGSPGKLVLSEAQEPTASISFDCQAKSEKVHDIESRARSMSRYLTPSKLGLLALISLYTDSFIHSAATIPILSFLVSYLLPIDANASHSTPREANRNFTISIDALQQVTITHSSAIPGRTVWDLLLNKLWEINSFDALHCFFDNLSMILEKPHEDQNAEDLVSPNPTRTFLARSSPLGAFVRRCQLEFTRLQFHDGVSLWKKFIAYRNPTLALWRRRHPGVSASIDVYLQENHVKAEESVRSVVYGDFYRRTRQDGNISTEDAEKLLEYQVDQMQKMGNRLPKEMRAQFRSMIEAGITVPSLSHYIEFLDSWKAGDYPSSFDNLHRYFDYTMHHRDRTFYQYALLNLAILQADFGCLSEAVDAMQEAISTARENHDMGCLNYSLSWLYHFGKEHPDEMAEIQKQGVLGTEKEALAFLKLKAKESNMWSLLSTTLLSEAKLALCNGGSVALAFENITKASHLNITKDVINAIGSQMAMQSSIFGRLGVSCQASLYESIFLHCYAACSPMEDVVRCTCKSANLLALKGRYEDALSRMDDVDQKSLRTLKYYHYWTTRIGLLKLQRHLHKDHLVAADHVLSQLQASQQLDPDLTFNISILEIDLRTQRGDYASAMNIVEKLATNLSKAEADVFQRAKLMILKARIYDKAGIPQKGFSVALRAASLAHKARILPVLWEAIGVVSRVLISLREFDAAAKLMESIMPQVLECEDCNLSALSFSCLADAQMGLAGDAKAESLQRKERLTKALEYIDRSFDAFSRIEDVKGQCEMMAKKATIMHLNGDSVLANDCAAKYLDIKRAAKELS